MKRLTLIALGVIALAVSARATTVLNESDSGTPNFSPDLIVSYSSMAMFPCNQTPLSGNSTPCSLPASFALNGVTVSGTGLQLLNNASVNGGAALPIGANDWLIYVSAGQSITFTFGAPVQAAGAILDTDLGGASLTVNGASYHHPGGSNAPYWLGATDDTGSISSIVFTAGTSGFLLDSLDVQNVQMQPTAEATPLVLVGTGLTFLSWFRRRRSAKMLKKLRKNGLLPAEHDISDDFVEIHAERQNG